MTLSDRIRVTNGDRFQICPEWVFLSPISAQAVRLYLVLRKFGDNQTETSFWSRKGLAEALGVKSPRSVDQYTRELVGIGALMVRPRYEGTRQTSNEYTVLTSPPAQNPARVAESCAPGVAESCSLTKTLYEPRPSKNSEAHDAPDGFEDFWAVYPRKKEKKRAQTAWKSAVKREPPEGIIAAAKNYAQERNHVKDGEQFTKHASTWLNNDCWEDYRTNPVKASPVFWADAL